MKTDTVATMVSENMSQSHPSQQALLYQTASGLKPFRIAWSRQPCSLYPKGPSMAEVQTTFGNCSDSMADNDSHKRKWIVVDDERRAACTPQGRVVIPCASPFQNGSQHVGVDVDKHSLETEEKEKETIVTPYKPTTKTTPPAPYKRKRSLDLNVSDPVIDFLRFKRMRIELTDEMPPSSIESQC